MRRHHIVQDKKRGFGPPFPHPLPLGGPPKGGFRVRRFPPGEFAMPRTRGRRRRLEQRLAGRQATRAHVDARHRADPPPHTIGRRECRCCRRTRPERTSTGHRALVSRSRDRTSSTPRRVDRALGTAHNGGFASWGSGCDFGALSSSFWPFSPLLRLDAAAAATHGQVRGWVLECPLAAPYCSWAA